jgi:3D (Asp-Asp-Asp) domain-containing protein
MDDAGTGRTLRPMYGLFATALLMLPSERGLCETDNSLNVIATAYNSVPSQTQGAPHVTAWGERLKPGMKAVAVSRDLIRMGLGRGRKVIIDGLEGHYIVKDKMNKRWKRRIDIYMGKNIAAALKWGKREVTIHWRNPPVSRTQAVVN